MQLTPVVAIHLSAALGALALGPVALWARLGTPQRPVLHRAFGYAWVTLMVAASVSALFIRDTRLPNLAGYTPIHLLVPVSLGGIMAALWQLARGNVRRHRRFMLGTYLGGCVGAGLFALLPGRLLGQWLWGG